MRYASLCRYILMAAGACEKLDLAVCHREESSDAHDPAILDIGGVYFGMGDL